MDSSSLCREGSAAPNGDSAQCTCAQGNISACIGAGLCPDGSDPVGGICRDLSNCRISATPQSVESGHESTLKWNTGCSPAYGCRYFGLPIVAKDATLNDSPVEPNGQMSVRPPFGNTTFETYLLTGNYYVGISPLLFKLDSYSCETTITELSPPTCADGTPAPDGDLANCTPLCQQTPVTGTCIDNADGTETARTTFGTCGQVDQLCR